jgi:hypothetical protein
VEIGQQHPQQTQQPERQQWVIDPEPAARISNHANIRSHEQAFGCKNYSRHRRVSMLATGVLVLLVTTGCLANPQRDQSRELLDQLTRARQRLSQPSPLLEACSMVGDVETRLYGEPGLVDVQPAWSQLADAAHALQAVCGQSTLLAQDALDTPAVVTAQQSWRQGVQHELGVACDHLRAAAAALEREAPC